MKAIAINAKHAIVLFAITFVYLELGVGLMNMAEGAWRIPASLVLVFFLPIVVSYAIKVYREFSELFAQPVEATA